jgi:hypothetical protein
MLLMTSSMASWAAAVIDVRLARPTKRLEDQETFYDTQARLPRIASFRDHDGYSGTIWRLGANGAQFELCAGPQEPVAGAGWALEVPGTRDPGPVATDPEGYGWRTWPDATPTGVRPAGRLRDCRTFYEDLLGLPVEMGRDGLTVTLPAERGLIRLEPVTDLPGPTVEDMLVFYFSVSSSRDQLARRLLDAGAPPVQPHNPWWQQRARCVADPDGVVLALAVDQ